MKRRICGVLIVIAAFAGVACGQAENAAQEDFAIALAKAHAKTHLGTASNIPFHLEAKITSRLALLGVGEGTYRVDFLDSAHWRRQITFADYQQTQLRLDSGETWSRSSPINGLNRLGEFGEYIDIIQPNPSGFYNLVVKEFTIKTGEKTEQCFSADPAKQRSEFPVHNQFCFDAESGLPTSEDFSMATHVVFADYVPFKGKQVPTHITATVSGLPLADIHASYSEVDPHVLDTVVVDQDMIRSSRNNEHRLNPEDITKGWDKYRPDPLLPPGTSSEDADKPVILLSLIDESGKLINSKVQSAPTEAMAEAALAIVQKWVFQPYLVDGKAVKMWCFEQIDFINLPKTK
jgi:hypothetical protein